MDTTLLCKTLSRAIDTGVRMYQEKELCFYTSPLNLQPDPVLPYVAEMLCRFEPVGIYTTPLFQFYAYFDTNDNHRIIIGPSDMPTEDTQQIESLLFLLNVPQAEKEAYMQKLRCAPNIPLARLVWFMNFLVIAVNHKPFSTEHIFMNTGSALYQEADVPKSLSQAQLSEDELAKGQAVRGSYEYEKMLLYNVEHGQAEQLREMLSAGINMKPGKMAKSVLRQVKNQGICGATVASRAAIAGGLDSKTAFGLSDLYIQKIEVLQDYAALTNLTNDIFIEFAERVKLAKYSVSANSTLFKDCARYIASNITSPLQTATLATTLHLSRSYLCTRFKAETGITISQYISQEKAEEAKRLLRYTDKNLSEIAVYLSYSSQSHFQNSFKKATGQTPMAYRRNNP